MSLLICARCAKEFPRTHPDGQRAKYCSFECRRTTHYERKTLRKYTETITPGYCKGCKSRFEFIYTNGVARQYCSDLCRRNARASKALAQPLCVFQGCANKRGPYSSGLCNSCYYRIRRTGTTQKRIWKYRSIQSSGYVLISDSNHPLATSSGTVTEHRKVLYDAIGEGPHTCHWCHISIKWMRGKCLKGCLVPDHLDGNKANNELTNLVPACNRCNATRGLFMSWVHKHQDDPWLWKLFNNSKSRKERLT